MMRSTTLGSVRTATISPLQQLVHERFREALGVVETFQE
jgi:hypothetical protein